MELKKRNSFFNYYFKNHGVLAVTLSLICLAMFFMAIIPADAVLSSGTFGYSQKYVGGVQVNGSDMSVAYDAKVPRNAAGEMLTRVPGEFKVTHYCACTICTWGSGITASGKSVAEGMIASDWRVLPKGTKVYVKTRNGEIQEFIVEDTGGAIKGNKIDIYVPSHTQALRLGVYYTELYVDPGTVLP